MRILSILAVYCTAAFCCFSIATAQETKAPPPSEEDSRMARIIERWVDANETEHDHVYREVMRGSDNKIDDDFQQWFVRLGGDQDAWDRARIQRRSVTEIFDRIAKFLNVDGPVVTRDQFISYANDHWPAAKSGVWREPPPFDAIQESQNLFKRLDNDRDGYLHLSEMAPALRAELNRWDTDEDRWITPEEYRVYFARRLDRLYREAQQRSEKPLPPLQIRIVENAERLEVPRPGMLPLGLPAWFEQVDTDRDGQVALFEWRAAGWRPEDFGTLDANDDGFLEPQEILKLLAVTERDGARPFTFLLQMRPTNTSSKR